MTGQPPVTVYVVCEAEYDARAAVAVFTNAAAAEQHAADCSDEASGAFRHDYEVIPLPFLGVVPQRALLHLHAARVCWDHGGAVEDEQTWTVDHWDYDLPAEPVVTINEHPVTPRVHVAAASAEAAESAFREAVEKVREAGTA